MSVFGDRIKELRIDRGENQKTVAEAVGSTAQSIGRYENGRNPDIEIAGNLAHYFGVTTDYLLGIDGGSNPTISEMMSLTGLSQKAIKNIMCDNIVTDINKPHLNRFFENTSCVKWVSYFYNFYDNYLSLQEEIDGFIKKGKEIANQIEECCSEGDNDLLEILFKESAEIDEKIAFKQWQMERAERECVKELMLRVGLKEGDENG